MWDKVERVFDVVIAIGILTLTWPIMISLWCWVKVVSSGSSLYIDERIGKNRVPFRMMKFRTMRPNTGSGHPKDAVTKDCDPRLIFGGATIRKWHLDELPQLFHVLSGKMSMVGPRPPCRGYFERDLNAIGPEYLKRFEVRPGCVGKSQLWGREDDTIESIERKFEHDIEYINDRTRLYFLILVRSYKAARTGI